jgi:hypothetical protein
MLHFERVWSMISSTCSALWYHIKKHVLDAKYEFMENLLLKGFTLSINPKIQISKNVYQGA